MLRDAIQTLFKYLRAFQAQEALSELVGRFSVHLRAQKPGFHKPEGKKNLLLIPSLYFLNAFCSWRQSKVALVPGEEPAQVFDPPPGRDSPPLGALLTWLGLGLAFSKERYRCPHLHTQQS